MKIFNNKIILFVFLIPVLFFMGLFGYKTFKDYQSYKKTESNIDTLSIAKKVDNAIDKIGKESLISAMGMKKSDITQARTATDNSLSLLDNEISRSIKNNIDTARLLVDNKDKNFINIFKKYYGERTTINLSQQIHSLLKNSSLGDKTEVAIFDRLSKMKADKYTEASLVAYAIGHKIKMSANGFKAWDSLLDDVCLPNFDIPSNQALSTKITQIIKPKTFESEGEDERALVASNAINGNYKIKSKAWANLLQKQISRLQKSQNLIIDDLVGSEQQKLNIQKQSATNNLIKAILFFVILAFLIYLLQNIAKEKRLLANTPENSQFDISEDKKIELESVASSKDAKNMHSFLTETAKEPSQDTKSLPELEVENLDNSDNTNEVVNNQVDQNSKINTEKNDDHLNDIHVLVVEDNPTNQKVIKSTLERYGINISLASDGKEAVELRKNNTYDLIFMDIQMPVMDGLEATKKIIEYEKNANKKHIPIIAHTANAQEADRQNCFEAGMDDFTTKPINAELMINVIKKHYPERIHGDLQTEVFDSSDATSLLIYTKNRLSGRIQDHILKGKGFECKIVQDENSFIDEIDRGSYKAVFVSAPLLPIDNCFIADFLNEKGTKLYIHTKDLKSDCKNINTYLTTGDILDELSVDK